MQLLDAVDREIAGLTLDEPDLDRTRSLGLRSPGEAEPAQIGGYSKAHSDAGGAGFENRPPVGTHSIFLKRGALRRWFRAHWSPTLWLHFLHIFDLTLPG